VGRGDATISPTEITLSPRTKRVIELAAEEANKLGHSHVGTEHLLLALVREGEGVATGVLESFGLSLEKVRHRVIATMGQQQAPPGARPEQPAAVSRQESTSGRGPFDRFNDRAKRVLALAQNEALSLNHNYLGPEHLLVGIMREGESVAAVVLNEHGVELGEVRRGVENLIGRGDATATPTEITLTPRTKKIIELAIDESRMLGHGHVGPEHLLLGLVRERGNNACIVLTQRGTSLEKVRESIIAKLGGAGGAQPSAS
jgi:ATP-dependent Clp protease ATP-binding subunit ClpA